MIHLVAGGLWSSPKMVTHVRSAASVQSIVFEVCVARCKQDVSSDVSIEVSLSLFMQNK